MSALVILLLALSSLGFAWTAFEPSVTRWWRSRKQHPIQVAWDERPWISQKDGDSLFMLWPLRIKNSSPKLTLEDVEARVSSIERRHHGGGGSRVIESPLYLIRSEQKRFDMLPGMPRDLGLFRTQTAEAPLNRIEFGRFDGHNSYHGFGPGLYKVNISIFGRDIEPLHIAAGVSLDPSGALSLGRWRDDLPWPFSAQPTPSATPAPQSREGTPAETQP